MTDFQRACGAAFWKNREGAAYWIIRFADDDVGARSGVI
jgi:hypothetical protein